MACFGICGWRRACLLLVCCLCWSASPPRLNAQGASPPKVPDQVVYCPDLTYGTAGQVPLMLDLAYPKVGTGPFPTVVVLHGAGPLTKGRKVYVPLVLDLAARGYVAAAVSYRYRPTEPFPAAVQDAKAALRWLREHAARYHIDGQRVAAVGFSGGGSLACMLGMTTLGDALEGGGEGTNRPCCVQAVVSYFAPTDLTQLHETTLRLSRTAPVRQALSALYVKSALEKWLGGAPTSVPEQYTKASPITYASKASAPLLLFHGSDDAVVPVDQARLMEKKLREAGGRVRLLILDKAPHDFDEIDDANSRRAAAETRAFLDEHLQRKTGADQGSPKR
jgi:acetyl esterase/lipase